MKKRRKKIPAKNSSSHKFHILYNHIIDDDDHNVIEAMVINYYRKEL